MECRGLPGMTQVNEIRNKITERGLLLEFVSAGCVYYPEINLVLCDIIFTIINRTFISYNINIVTVGHLIISKVSRDKSSLRNNLSFI